jgi:hypothetical protein
VLLAGVVVVGASSWRGLGVPERDGDVVLDRAFAARGDHRIVDPLDVDKGAVAVTPVLAGERDERVHAIGTDEFAVPQRDERGAASGHDLMLRGGDDYHAI